MNKQYRSCQIETTDQGEDIITLEHGYETIILDKLYGPTIFANLRIRAVISPTAEWVIERQSIINREVKWVEHARIPAQLDGEFDEANEPE